MTLVRVLSLAVLVAGLAAGATEKDVFDLKVERVRMLRNQSGDLHIGTEGVTFRSSDGKTTVTISMKDLREADVADPHALRFETYEVQKWKPIERREFTFRAEPDAPVEELAQRLRACAALAKLPCASPSRWARQLYWGWSTFAACPNG